MSIFYTGDWHSVGGDYYRKVELYTLAWSGGGGGVDVENYCVVGAPYGGPLAVIRDDKKFTKVSPGTPAKPLITIYTSSGSRLGAIKVRS